MSIEINELQDSARQVVAGLGLAVDEQQLWSQIVELGWLLVSVPESLAGLDAGIEGACAMHTELGCGLSTAPYMPAMLAVDAICQSDLNDRDSRLETIMAGELVTVPLSACEIQKQGGVLQGTATAVQSADNASHILLWTSDQQTLALVALDQAGVEVIARPTWDPTRRLFDVKLEGVDAAAQTLLYSDGNAEPLVKRLTAQRDFALAADAIGGASALLTLTVEHLQTRVQFKRPLAMFQALKHRCADIKAAIIAAEATLADALGSAAADLSSEQAQLKAKGAKLLATGTFADVAEDCLQLQGGIGMADEHPCHLFLKRALLSQQLSGSADQYAIDIAKQLIATAG